MAPHAALCPPVAQAAGASPFHPPCPPRFRPAPSLSPQGPPRHPSEPASEVGFRAGPEGAWEWSPEPRGPPQAHRDSLGGDQ